MSRPSRWPFPEDENLEDLYADYYGCLVDNSKILPKGLFGIGRNEYPIEFTKDIIKATHESLPDDLREKNFVNFWLDKGFSGRDNQRITNYIGEGNKLLGSAISMQPFTTGVLGWFLKVSGIGLKRQLRKAMLHEFGHVLGLEHEFGTDGAGKGTIMESSSGKEFLRDLPVYVAFCLAQSRFL